MAGAAVADAQYKDRRREELDRRLDDAKRVLNRLQQESGRIEDAQIPPPNRFEEEALQQHLQKPEWNPRESLKRPPSRQSFLLDTLAGLCHHPGVLDKWQLRYEQRDGRRHIVHRDLEIKRYWGDNQADPTIDLHAVSRRIDGAEARSGVPQREPKSPRQFEVLTQSINYLVDNLTYEAVHVSHPNDPEAAKRAYESLDGSMTKLKFLRSDGYPVYQHPDYEPDKTIDSRRELSRMTRLIFSNWEGTLQAAKDQRTTIEPFWYQSMVHKLCHNLLVSVVPPGVHNYNVLINGFTRVGQHSLAQIVVDHIYRSRLRPTRQTAVCLLHHFRANQDVLGFYDVLRRITGRSSDGMKIARRDLDAVLMRPRLRAWAQSRDVAVAGEFVIQRMTLDKSVLEAMIQGMLSFDCARDAARVFVSAMEEKIVLSTQVLRRLVERILDSLHPDAAMSVLHSGLMRHVDHFGHVVGARSEATRALIKRIRLLFDLAGTQPWTPAMGALSSHDKDFNNRRLVLAMFIADTASYLAYLAKYIIPSIENYLACPLPSSIGSSMGTHEDTSDKPQFLLEELHQDTLADNPDISDEPWDTAYSDNIPETLPEILTALSSCNPSEPNIPGPDIYHRAAEYFYILSEETRLNRAATYAKEEFINILSEYFPTNLLATLHRLDVDIMDRVQMCLDIRAHREAERTLVGKDVFEVAVVKGEETTADSSQADSSQLEARPDWRWEVTQGLSPRLEAALKLGKPFGGAKLGQISAVDEASGLCPVRAVVTDQASAAPDGTTGKRVGIAASGLMRLRRDALRAAGLLREKTAVDFHEVKVWRHDGKLT